MNEVKKDVPCTASEWAGIIGDPSHGIEGWNMGRDAQIVNLLDDCADEFLRDNIDGYFRTLIILCLSPIPLQGKRKDHGRDYHIYASLSAVPGLCDSIGMEKGMQFIRLAARLKDKIITAQPPSHGAAEPPADIPDDIRTFLSAAVDLPMDYVDGCWKAFRP
ncbi:hypothetical protein B0H13DRAFT_1900205 [Mycena leptocephala]|nr:hypothetical protein B0H13DRAFT_1900205 [Mycena leptocephala]